MLPCDYTRPEALRHLRSFLCEDSEHLGKPSCVFSMILIIFHIYKGGPLAHLVEHLICNEGVAGSSPVGSTNKAPKGVFLFVDPK
jgi:hypothetical protein